MLYGTSEGYTRKITDFLVEVARGQGHTVGEVAVENVKSAEALAEVDGILLAASVHMGQYTDTKSDYEFADWEQLRRFAEQFLDVLEENASALLIEAGCG